ncbi:hypothetical protein BDN72DRAFT_850624 [Pluteus cervinus]|uniref:Uncharacterized protein n=1 Tax=Pluteus cervinus TaxID=181527 RepID=A0ACD3A3P1_9AGAR|nr:hypothetical protein BDN72DRAFT_850624 [Pluteus cervinus]
MKGDKEGSNSVDLPVRRRSGHEDRSHKLPPSKSTFHKDTDITFRNHGHLGLSGEMPFRPLWLNWTLKFLNSDLSALTLFTDCIPRDVLHNTLSNIYLPALAVLSLYDKTISFDALGVFLQRHSSTLTNLSLFIERPDSSQPVDPASVTRRNRIFAKQRVAFDFPKLESLSSNPFCIQWLFKGILSFRPPASGIRSKLSKSRPHAHLPKLSMLSISSYLRFSESGFFPRLDSAFQTLAEFVKLASPHTTDALPPENAWFSVMSLNAEVIDEQSHIEWLQSHVSQGATSPLLALHTVSDLCLNPTTTLGPGGLRALPKFLALFKGLKKLTLTLRSTDALKKLDTDFWKAFRQDCPGLETLVLQTPPAVVQVTMESLIDGTAF